MRVLVIASRKGGAGKTTVAGHLAVEAERSGDGPVALIDVDPQGSLADWWNNREGAAPHFVQTTLPRLDDDILRLKDSGPGFLIVDTPPALTATISQVIAHADLVVIPTRPSPHDLRSIGSTMDVAESLNKDMVFVINCAAPRTRITYETIALLSQHGTVAPTVLHQRVDFACSMIDGRTVMEVAGGSKSAGEVRELWYFLRQRMDRRRPKSDLVLPTRVPLNEDSRVLAQSEFNLEGQV
ncbi:MAG: ParA family protein [Pseudomonadota bacterium]